MAPLALSAALRFWAHRWEPKLIQAPAKLHAHIFDGSFSGRDAVELVETGDLAAISHLQSRASVLTSASVPRN